MPNTFAEEFGEKNITDPGYAYDPGPPMNPPRRSSAAIQAGRRRQGEAEAARQSRNAALYHHARTVAEDEALERTTRAILDGKPPLARDVEAAARAVRRNQSPVPTAEQHAAKARTRRQDQEPEQEPPTTRPRDRYGRRPRS